MVSPLIRRRAAPFKCLPAVGAAPKCPLRVASAACATSFSLKMDWAPHTHTLCYSHWWTLFFYYYLDLGRFYTSNEKCLVLICFFLGGGTGWEMSCWSGVKTGEAYGGISFVVRTRYLAPTFFSTKPTRIPWLKINISVKEEKKKNRFYVFYFLNKSLCSLTFTCRIIFPRMHSVRFEGFSRFEASVPLL